MVLDARTEKPLKIFGERLERLKTMSVPQAMVNFDLGHTYDRLMSQEEIDSLWKEHFEELDRKNKRQNLHVYVHSLYCVSKCAYCHCKSFKLSESDSLEKYIDYICGKATHYGALLDGRTVTSIYFGGGTPTIYEDSEFERLIGGVTRSFNTTETGVICCEMNPFTASKKKIEAAVACGINRISFGVQSLNPDVLARVNRAYQTEEMVGAAIRSAKAAGVAEVNVDLMAFLDGETPETLAENIRKIAAMKPDSIVLYRYHPLEEKEEPGGIFGRYGWDEAVNIFSSIVDEEGYEGDEARAFANSFGISVERRGSGKKRDEGSRVNMGTYSSVPRSVIGIGPFATSFIFNKAVYETRLYRNNVYYTGNETTPDNEARLFLVLNCLEHAKVNLREFEALFDMNPESAFSDVIEVLKELNVLKIEEDTLIWTARSDAELVAAATLFYPEDLVLEDETATSVGNSIGIIKRHDEFTEETFEQNRKALYVKSFLRAVGLADDYGRLGVTVTDVRLSDKQIVVYVSDGKEERGISMEPFDGRPCYAASKHIRFSSLTQDTIPPFAADCMQIFSVLMRDITFSVLESIFIPDTFGRGG